MKNSEQLKDQGLRQAVQHANEAAERMKLPEDFTDRLMQRIAQEDEPPKRRHRWAYFATAIAVAASITLLMVIHFNTNNTDRQPTLVAQKDTTMAHPQKAAKNMDEQQQKKEENVEETDAVKKMKEPYRTPRPPKHYMAKQSTREEAPEPILADADFSTENAFTESEQQVPMEMIPPMNGSLQDDYLKMTREIRERGNRMNQQVEMAINDDAY